MKDTRRSNEVSAREARKLALMRRTDSATTTDYTIGGRHKEGQGNYRQRPITLTKMPWDTERKDGDKSED